MTSVRSPRPRAAAALIALNLALAAALVGASLAHAAPDAYDVSVASGDVSVPGSLPWAVAQAESDPDHTDITILPSAGPLITLDGNLAITTDVTITGPGPSALTVVGSAAAPSIAVFDVTGAGPVEIGGMSIAPTPGGTLHGIRSVAASLSLSDLSLDGFSDDNLRIDDGSLEATDIVTTNSVHDGLSYVTFSGDAGSLSNVTAEGNAEYGFVLGNFDGTLDTSDLTAKRNGGGIYVLAFTSTTTVTRATATDNSAEGVRVIASDSDATLVDVRSSGNGLAAACGCGGPGVAVIASDGSTVEISGAVVTDNTAAVGAGISLESVQTAATVLISGSTVTGNHAFDGGAGVGGGIAVGGHYDSDSAVSIVDSTISGNDAEDGGGGVYLTDLGVGAPTGPVSITRTTVDDNSAAYGAGILLDGSSGTTGGGPALSIRNSTISNNTAAEEGAGLYLYQDPADPPSAVLVTGSTVSGNTALGTSGIGNGGGLYIESAGPSAQLQVRIENSTIAANDPPGVGGVYVDGVGVDLVLQSSILAGNDRGDLSFDPAIAGFTAQWSLVQDASLAGLPLDPAGGNLVGVDPKLGALAANGGTTLTMLVSPGSPAYNAGDPAFVGAGLFDQRGLPRVYQRLDIGAVEWQPALAHTGSAAFEPEPALVAVLLILVGIAMVASSRLRAARSLH